MSVICDLLHLRFEFSAARFHGLSDSFTTYPGAHAPGFMLSPAPQAANSFHVYGC